MIVKLDDVVDKISGNEDRFTTDLVYYLAGEHYESERIAIYKKGVLQDDLNLLGFKFHFPFKAGDTIFMSRNPHLKKAGMVTYDGICSDTSYILRTKDNSVLLERFLPLVLQNDRFWNWFEENKSGSVNYLLNWKTLKEYEFDLPPIDEQQRIADLAWAMERTRVAYEQMIAATDALVKSQFIEMFGDPDTNPKQWAVKSIGDIATDVHYGTSKPAIEGGIYPYLRMNNLTADGYIDLTDLKYIDLPENELDGCLVHYGDILFNRTNSKEWVGKTALFDLDQDMVIAGYIIRVRVNSEVLPCFLVKYMNLPYMKKMLRGMAKGAVHQANINAKEMQSIKLFIPPLELQQQFAELVRQTDKSKFELTQALEALNATYKKLISENLG
ncbi:MAG: restriction endonuclease subunit S [Ruminococcus sp.]|nr:restriction endonuclease subunit S [Ruminococcus sp.]